MAQTQEHAHPPIGNLLLRTLAMPGDANPAGDIFGGWIMSQMDISGGDFSKRHCRRKSSYGSRRRHELFKTGQRR